MLLKSLKLVNYAGIYNGMLLKEIFIDFTKCKSASHIILIRGDNGSGKSTLEKAMKPLPDSNDSFIIGENALKEIEYIDEVNGIEYSIRYVHECKNGNRTTKGFVYKTDMRSGTTIEMNPTGNITSCKEIIFDEFQLDPNYISLMQLTSSERGLADLRPSERKKFVNSILNSTDVYNNYYKILSKKSSVYKEMIRSIQTKIDSIGNPGYLQSKVKELDALLENRNTALKAHTGSRYEAQKKLEEIRDNSDNPFDEISKYKTKLPDIENALAKRVQAINRYKDLCIEKVVTFDTLDILEDYQVLIEESISQNSQYTTELCGKIDYYKNANAMILAENEKDARELEKKTTKLNSLTDGFSLTENEKVAEQYRQSIAAIEQEFGFINCNEITVNEYKAIYNVLREIYNQSSQFIANSNKNYLRDDYEAYYSNLISSYNDDLISKNVTIDKYRKLYEEYHTIKKLINSEVPSNCKISTCPYRLKNTKMQDRMDEIEKKELGWTIEYTTTAISEIELEKADVINAIETAEQDMECAKIIHSYIRNLDNLFYIIKDMFINLHISSSKELFTYIISNNNWDILMSVCEKIISKVDKINMLNEYNHLKSELAKIEAKLNALNSNKEFINSLTEDIAKLNKSLEESYQVCLKNNEKINKYEAKLRESADELEKLKALQKLVENTRINRDEYFNIKKYINNHEDLINQISHYTNQYEVADRNIKLIEEEINKLKPERDEVIYNLKTTDKYNKEMREYNEMYQKLETLKYYASPSTGIQLLFVKIYMSNIINTANQLLSGLFGGQLSLMPFSINDSEFRIPVAVDCGLNHDDITTMSSAQISLISMIISIAMLNQTSTKLNIIIGDEIDAPFDMENRVQFFNILKQLMAMVRSNQCILISHNSEIEESDCDIILLKNENGNVTNGNIIWSYYNN